MALHSLGVICLDLPVIIAMGGVHMGGGGVVFSENGVRKKGGFVRTP